MILRPTIKKMTLLTCGITAVLFLIAYTVFLGQPGTMATVTVQGSVIQTIDLSQVDEPYSFTVTTPDESGENTIEVASGRIRVSHADCPDGICVSTGWISSRGTPIVCLPHGLTVTISQGGESDGIDATTR